MQKFLDKFGCDNFGMMTKNADGTTLVTFTHNGKAICIEASWKGYASAWLAEYPWNSRRKSDRSTWNARAIAQGKIAVPSMIRDWVKAQITMVEIGAFEFDEAFLPHIQLTDGRRVIDHARDGGLLGLPKPDEG
ncbi:MAG: hypothetical protein AAGI12_15485 [Pseudomonadota bacterium]